jgi:hypothetical protein
METNDTAAAHGGLWAHLDRVTQERQELSKDFARFSTHLPPEQIRWDFGAIQRRVDTLLMNVDGVIGSLWAAIRSLEEDVRALRAEVDALQRREEPGPW